jgi:outer membrane protein OmpA-like peptidoglycan-associated protein
MNETRGARHAPVWPLASLCVLLTFAATALADPQPTVVDSQRIIKSLQAAPAVATRSLVVEARPSAPASQKITLDIRFANDSDRLTDAAHTQLTELGTALTSPQLGRAHFMIAGHTSATGAADHNQRLSESRARAVRSYLVAHFHIEPQRLASVGYGAAQPLPDYPPTALEQRRVEISTVPGAF